MAGGRISTKRPSDFSVFNCTENVIELKNDYKKYMFGRNTTFRVTGDLGKSQIIHEIEKFVTSTTLAFP